mgnify:CR=1 FL=1
MTLDDLTRHPGLWRGGAVAREGGLPTGLPVLDELLPGGGWPAPGLVEILSHQIGVGGLRVVLPTLATLSQGGRWLIWVAPPHQPYAPALQAAGVALDKVLVVEPEEGRPPSPPLPEGPPVWRKPQDSELWALEQALRFTGCGAALAWVTQLEGLALRRLQLACEAGGSLGFLFRPATDAAQPSPAALRLLLAVDAESAQIEISVRKCRGVSPPRSCRLPL